MLLTGGAEPKVRLADFGLATVNAAQSRMSRISTVQAAADRRGTWPYMAPEMYRSRAAPAAAASRGTDVFAFGTLLWELFAGRAAWADYSEMDRLRTLLLGTEGEGLELSALPADTPPPVVALLAACLKADRTQRPRMAEVLGALEQALDRVASGHFDVFLSYSWGAAAVRQPLAREVFFALRAEGLRVWLDEHEMGHDLKGSMSEGIAASDAVVLLLSPDYAASAACMFEVRAAAAAGKPLVTCIAEPGFWRSWPTAGGGPDAAPALPDGHELVELARLKTHLFVELGESSRVDWRQDLVPAQQRRRFTHAPAALPRLLALLREARREAQQLGGAATRTSATEEES